VDYGDSLLNALISRSARLPALKSPHHLRHLAQIIVQLVVAIGQAVDLGLLVVLACPPDILRASIFDGLAVCTGDTLLNFCYHPR
jgi:hypothetical protein